MLILATDGELNETNEANEAVVPSTEYVLECGRAFVTTRGTSTFNPNLRNPCAALHMAGSAGGFFGFCGSPEVTT
jgi:hypothetical protein